MRPGNPGTRQFNQMQPVLIPVDSKTRSLYGVSRPNRKEKGSRHEQSLALQRRQLLELVSLLVLGACSTVLLLINLG